MIGYIEGKVVFSDGHSSIILTKMGIGYEVNLPKILVEGEDVELYISHIFREADQELFAFVHHSEKKIFETLLKVKGVGAKSAFAIIRHLGPSKTVRAIKLEDKQSLQSVPGIGPKAAAQIVLDLKGKVDQALFSLPSEQSWMAKDGVAPSSQKKTKRKTNETAMTGEESGEDTDTLVRETILACRELGFRDQQVTIVIRELLEEETFINAESLLQKVLKNLATQVR